MPTRVNSKPRPPSKLSNVIRCRGVAFAEQIATGTHAFDDHRRTDSKRRLAKLLGEPGDSAQRARDNCQTGPENTPLTRLVGQIHVGPLTILDRQWTPVPS